MNGFEWTAFWAMGGYAGYVWPAFGLTLGALALECVQLALVARRVTEEDDAVED